MLILVVDGWVLAIRFVHPRLIMTLFCFVLLMSISSLMVQNGDISLFDLDHESVVEAETENDLGYGDNVQEIAPTLKFKAHGGSSRLAFSVFVI
jgi:hypothetical protein